MDPRLDRTRWHLEPHRCDEECVCPDHPDLALIWAPGARLHACQLIECRYGHGLEDHLPVLPPQRDARDPRGPEGGRPVPTEGGPLETDDRSNREDDHGHRD